MSAPNRKQVTQLQPGDRVVVQTKHTFEVQNASNNGETVTLVFQSVPCNGTCPNNCGCDGELLAGIDSPLRLTFPSNRRLEYLGNLAELLQTLEQTKARIDRLRSSPDGFVHKEGDSDEQVELGQ